MWQFVGAVVVGTIVLMLVPGASHCQQVMGDLTKPGTQEYNDCTVLLGHAITQAQAWGGALGGLAGAILATITQRVVAATASIA